MSASNRIAIVTGASRGLGAVIAGVLAERQFELVLGGRDTEALREIATSLGKGNLRHVSVDGDVTEESVRARMIEAARERGGLDVLVNNASELGDMKPLASADLARVGRVFRVNIGAPLALAQLAIPLLAARRGLIVNISSDAAHGAYPGWGAYGASKAALELLTRTLAGELRDAGVAAAIVDPGDMRTRMHQEAFPLEDISDRPLPDVTAPFWNWLLDQPPSELNGQRFMAQQEDARWLQQV